MRTLLIDKDGEVTLGEKIPEPMPSTFVRVGAFDPVSVKYGLVGDNTAVNLDTFAFRGYVALWNGRNVLAIYEQV